jgi:tyrosine-protein kinase Etk/Wzc
MPQYELNLRDYWQIIGKRQMVLWVIFFAVLIPTVIYTNMQKPLYQAVASVQWIERRTFANLLAQFVGTPMRTGDPLVTQSKIITSLPVLEKVVKELGLVAEHANADEVMEQAASIQGAVSTNVASGTNLIYINVTYENPKMAANIANKIAEVYIAENLREKSKESRSVREFIEKQLEEVSVKLKKSEEALARFKEAEVPSGVGLALQNRLADLEARHQSLFQKYTEIHPDVKNIEEEMIRVKDQLKALPQKELGYNRLTRDVEINANIYRQLKDKLESARIAEAEKIEDASLVDSAFPPGAPFSPNKPLNYFFGAIIGLMLGLTGTFLFEQLDTSIGTIEDVEGYLKLPVLGVIPYLKTEDEKKRGLILKLWPKEFKGKEKILRLRKQLLIHYSSSSPAFEAYRILRTNIQTEVFKEKIQGKIILFSSSGPEEGKSITISNLAIVLAQGGLRTLLIDGDMRRSAIHNIFGIKKEPGLCNLLGESIEFKDAVRTFTDILTGEIGFGEALKMPGLDNLNILPGGSLPMLPAELLASSEMAALLQKLRDKYDIILIDSPPVMAVADAVILAPKTDGVILVYRVGKTARAVLFRAKTQLVKSGAQVRGIVLNNMSPEMEMRYGYYYHYKYYGKYYTSPKEKTEKI